MSSGGVEVIGEIPLDIDSGALLQKLHLVPGTAEAGELEELLQQARELARPKAVYREAFIQARGPDTVTIEGVTFRSRALRMNLDKVERVFPFIATCGRELDGIEPPAADPLKQFWLEAVKTTVLRSATGCLDHYLTGKFALGKTAVMNPGSGEATVWPIEQQKELFSLFGDIKKLIGVTLSDSFLMSPNKSVSGIRFATEIDYRNCQLCRREICPSRRAPFDRDLWEVLQGPGYK